MAVAVVAASLTSGCSGTTHPTGNAGAAGGTGGTPTPPAGLSLPGSAAPSAPPSPSAPASATATTRPAAPAGSNYFRWGVESNTTSVGTVRGYFGTTARDCTVRHSGSCSMRLTVRGNDGGNQQLGAELDLYQYPFSFVGAPALYYRWWMRIEPGFSWGAATAKTKSSRTGGGPISSHGTTAQGYTGYVMSYGFLIGECGAAGCRLANGAVNNDGNLYVPHDFRRMADGAWHEYIVMVKPNTSASCTVGVSCDAELQAWVDGRSVGRYAGFKLHDDAGHSMVEGWGGWMVTPYFQLNGTAADGGTIYVDDFSTDTVYNSLR